MSAKSLFRVVFHKDGSATALGRVTASSTTNSLPTGIRGEGYFVQQTDVTSITRKIYNKSSSTPDTAISSTSLTVANVVKNALETSTALWGEDETGYNFEDTIAASNFDTADAIFEVDYVWVLSGSEGFTTTYQGRAEP